MEIEIFVVKGCGLLKFWGWRVLSVKIIVMWGSRGGFFFKFCFGIFIVVWLVSSVFMLSCVFESCL